MSQSQTAHYLEHAALYGEVPLSAKYDFPAPDTDTSQQAIAEIMAVLAGLFASTCLETETESTLWQLVNIFHRKAQKLEQELDRNSAQQQALHKEQDGSEIQSVALEEALARGQQIETRWQAMCDLREAAAEQFAADTGSVWLPQSGSRARQGVLTGSLVDSRDFINAQKLQKTATLIPAGTRIALAGGKNCDHSKVVAVLEKTRATLAARGETLVLLHGGAEGVEKIGSLWATSKGIAQVIFRPAWNQHGKAAPFKRNDAILHTAPAGLIVLHPENGIHEQIIREAKRMGIKLKIFR
jgi:hypothetical protein